MEMKVGQFWGKARAVPWAHGGGETPVQVYFSGDESFCVSFGGTAAQFSVWTDEAGLEAIINTCQSVLVRARIALDEANGVPA